MRFTLCALLVVGLSTLQLGCGSSDESLASIESRGMAVVDLDAVAKKLGRDVEMQKLISERQTALNQQLAAIQDNLRSQFEDKKTEFGPNPTEDQTQQLVAIQNQINLELRRTKATAQNDLERYKQGLIAEFREEVKPVVKQIAAENGIGVVVPKNEAIIFTFEPESDITELVASAMPESSVARESEISQVSHEEEQAEP